VVCDQDRCVEQAVGWALEQIERSTSPFVA